LRVAGEIAHSFEPLHGDGIPLPMIKLRCPQTTRRVVGVVLLALMLVQWAALVHAVNHAPALGGALVVADADPHWGHDSGTPTCHLLDHLLLGQAIGSTGVQVPHLEFSAAAPGSADHSVTSRPAAHAYEARGPPRA